MLRGAGRDSILPRRRRCWPSSHCSDRLDAASTISCILTRRSVWLVRLAGFVFWGVGVRLALAGAIRQTDPARFHRTRRNLSHEPAVRKPRRWCASSASPISPLAPTVAVARRAELRLLAAILRGDLVDVAVAASTRPWSGPALIAPPTRASRWRTDLGVGADCRAAGCMPSPRQRGIAAADLDRSTRTAERRSGASPGEFAVAAAPDRVGDATRSPNVLATGFVSACRRSIWPEPPFPLPHVQWSSEA